MDEKALTEEIERLKAENADLRSELAGTREVTDQLRLRRDLTDLVLAAGGDPRVAVPMLTVGSERVELDAQSKLTVVDSEGNVIAGRTPEALVSRLAREYPLGMASAVAAPAPEPGSYAFDEATAAKVSQGFATDSERARAHQRRMAEAKANPRPHEQPPKQAELPIAPPDPDETRSKVASGMKGSRP